MAAPIVAAVLGVLALAGVWLFGARRRSRAGGPSSSGTARPSARSTRSAARRGVEDLPPHTVDIEQLTEWVLTHIPAGLSANLEAEDIRKIVEWNLEFIRSKRVATNGHASKPATHVIVAGAETAEYILQQASSLGLDYTPEQVHAILEAQMTYLESIGAAGPEIDGA